MTIHEWLIEATTMLSKAKIDSARLDALVLLSEVLQKDKSWVLAYSDYVLQGSELHLLNTFVTQRVSHTPLAYILGHTEFYGNTFAVNSSVLVPRPESEAFLELLNTLDLDSFSSVIDVGTGSGALAISAALICPGHTVYATDISAQALTVAKNNSSTHGVSIHFYEGDLLEPIPDKVLENSVLLCNLPYVPADYPVNTAATHEPDLALYSGTEGLDHYTKLFSQISARKTKPLHVLTESLLTQHDAVSDLAHKAGYMLVSVNVLVQHFVLV